MVCSAFLEEIITRLDAHASRAKMIQRRVTHEQLNWHPHAGSWSIAEIFEHLRLSTAKYLPAMEQAIERAQYGNDRPVRHTLVGRMIIQGAGPSGNAPVPKALLPKPGPYGDPVIRSFIRDTEEIIELAKRAEGIDLSATKVANPFAPFLKMNLADCFEILASHADRHLAQIDEILRLETQPPERSTV